MLVKFDWTCVTTNTPSQDIILTPTQQESKTSETTLQNVIEMIINLDLRGITHHLDACFWME